MSAKRTTWFVVMACVIVGIGLVATRALQPAPTAAALDMAAMPVLARNMPIADRIQIVHQHAVLNLERRGQTWCLAQDGGYPVRPALAERLIEQLLALRLIHPKASASQSPRADEFADDSAIGIRVLATTGVGLGAIIVAEHPPGTQAFIAHQVGDPRDWQAEGALDVPTDPIAWVDTKIIPLDPATVAGAQLTLGAESSELDASTARARLAALQGVAFTAIRPAAQLEATEAGRAVFKLTEGGALTVSILREADQEPIWLELAADGPAGDALHVPPGRWAFRYPADTIALLRQAP